MTNIIIDSGLLAFFSEENIAEAQMLGLLDDEDKFLVGIFTRSGGATLRDALTEQFKNMAGVTIADYTNIHDKLAKQTMNMVDIAIICTDSFNDAQIMSKTAMLLEVNSAEKSNQRTSFMSFYDSDNYAEVAGIVGMLKEKGLCMMHCSRVEDAEDFEIYAQSVYGIISSMRQTRVSMQKIFAEGLKEGLEKLYGERKNDMP